MIRMDIAAALDAFVAIAAVAIMFAIGITIYDERRKGKELVGEAVAEEAEEEPKRPNILQRIIKREDEGTKKRDDGNIRVVLEMPREIRIKVDPNDLIAYLFTKKKVEAEVEEAEEGAEGEEEGRVSTEVLLRKGLVKEG